jgi:phage terminase small subunit
MDKRKGERKGLRKVVTKVVDDGDVPKELKKIVGTRQMMEDALEYGITDFEYMFVQKVLQDPFMSGVKAYLELKPDVTRRTAQLRSSQLMNKPRVIEYYKHCVKKRLKIGIVSEEEIVYNLKTIALQCQQAVPVLDKEGKPTGEFRFDANAAIRAWELLGKNIGMFKDKVEVTGAGGGPIETIEKTMTMQDATAIFMSNLKGKQVDNGTN